MPRCQWTVRHQGYTHLPADGKQFSLDLTVDQIIMIFHNTERRKTVIPCGKLHIVKLITVHGGSAQSPHLSRLHQLMQRLHRLLYGRVIIEPMYDIDIQIVRPQTF